MLALAEVEVVAVIREISHLSHTREQILVGDVGSPSELRRGDFAGAPLANPSAVGQSYLGLVAWTDSLLSISPRPLPV